MSSAHREKRIVITGMSAITTLGDTLEELHANLLQGKSGITRWKHPHYSATYSQIGGDLSDYDVTRKMESFRNLIPAAVFQRMSRLVIRSPWATQISILAAVQAFLDAGLFEKQPDPERFATVLAGPYMHDMYKYMNWELFTSDPHLADTLFGIREWDGDTEACICETLGLPGPSLSIGGLCASGNIALRSAMDEIGHHDCDAALIIGSISHVTPVTLQSWAKMGAISITVFDEDPARASRPFDSKRNGFVPAYGCGMLVVEDLDHALRRGAKIYAEVEGIAINCNASRNPAPSEAHMLKVMEQALRLTGTDRNEIDYISAHATSTRVGDIAEISAIRKVFGDHAKNLKINALKSMLGHMMSSCATVEIVASLLQMQYGFLYPSINIDSQDPEIDLDVCANHAVRHKIQCMMKNAFGFGGINSAGIFRRYP